VIAIARPVPRLDPPALRILCAVLHAVLAPEQDPALDGCAGGADERVEPLLVFPHPGVEIGGHRAELAFEAHRQRRRCGWLVPPAAVPARLCTAAIADRKRRSSAGAVSGYGRFRARR